MTENKTTVERTDLTTDIVGIVIRQVLLETKIVAFLSKAGNIMVYSRLNPRMVCHLSDCDTTRHRWREGNVQLKDEPGVRVVAVDHKMEGGAKD